MTLVVPAPALSAQAESAARPRLPYLVPVLGLRQELVLRLIGLSWAISSVWFWLWWTAPVRGDWNLGRALSSIGLLWLFALAAYFLFFVCRMTKPNPALPLPSLRVAIVVTKAPSEPWDVAERTLRAMLNQDMPYPYDVWLADERPSGKTLHWCRGHGVHVSTRKGVTEYHQPTWPRRTKCKEGNLAYFYDRVGYAQYDVVAQLDVDHVPERGYLAEMVRPFLDPKVGYVAAPSICDANEGSSWTVRGRLYREASMHGPVQAGCNGGWAPVCIGSHYAVRTQALQEAGGIGPDLAEDYSTTLWMQAAGWHGVFALDAEAHGDGPESLNDMLVQELQWARSLGTIFTKWAPSRLPRCSWKAGLRLGFALAYYLLQGVACVVAFVLPPAGVLMGLTWGNTSLAGFYVHLWPASMLLTAALLWLRRQRVLRPVGALVWSYELLLFQLVRWPWTTWGFFQGMWAGLVDRRRDFRVTPKGAQAMRPLSARLLVPMALLIAVPTAVVALVPRPGVGIGLYVVLVLQALVYCIAGLSVVMLHVDGNRQPERAGRRRRGNHALRLRVRLTSGSGGRALLLMVPVIVTSICILGWRSVGVITGSG